MFDVKEYLKRIDAKESLDKSIKYLTYLQNQNLLALPFENLDVLNKIPIMKR